MSSCHRAIDILKQARDILTERLSERILESRDEILEDAIGLSYTSEIDAIYEQLGHRLQHLNSMIANLPEQQEPESKDPSETFSVVVEEQSIADEVAAGLTAEPRRLPAPVPIAGLISPKPAADFKQFAIQVQSGNLDGATVSLADLLGLEVARARRCTEEFQEKVARNSEIMAQAVRLRHELARGKTNRALLLLWECFGLHGVESIHVMQTLRNRMAAS